MSRTRISVTVSDWETLSHSVTEETMGDPPDERDPGGWPQDGLRPEGRPQDPFRQPQRRAGQVWRQALPPEEEGEDGRLPGGRRSSPSRRRTFPLEPSPLPSRNPRRERSFPSFPVSRES